jgi:hypothetical protein
MKYIKLFEQIKQNLHKGSGQLVILEAEKLVRYISRMDTSDDEKLEILKGVKSLIDDEVSKLDGATPSRHRKALP